MVELQTQDQSLRATANAVSREFHSSRSVASRSKTPPRVWAGKFRSLTYIAVAVGFAIERSRFVLLDADPDQVPGDVVAPRQPVQSIAGQNSCATYWSGPLGAGRLERNDAWHPIPKLTAIRTK